MAHGEALRIRVIKAVVEDGLSRNEAARIFRVGIASAIRWVKAFEETQRTAALPTGGDRRSVLKPHRDWLLELRRKENDLTLDAIAERLLRRHGVEADKSMLSRFFAGEGISFKKTVHASEQDRPDVVERRQAWRCAQTSLGGRLIFLDETWTTTAMTRRYAWADVGTRALGHAPHGHWKTTTFLAGLTCKGLIAPFVLDGPINAECFFAYVEQILVPALREGDTVILDNLSSHKNEAARRLIADAGASLLFLPPYSPDLNPIEMAFAKLKELLRQAQARTVDALWDLIGRSLSLFTPEECANYIRHCGYNPL
ncbi:IS630 family transposase [Bradyrhizobium guangzhouense]|uniref:IS630 family transposase n=1 Tax=Bradyrhizobium guangzhouense TaxID=1325095 RepID=A0AAE6C7D9_9BRAD|nr:IS630 family transposase [Bradyrhizobium guangzhouense]QAU45372.1 IS630 family transposase [Bradyrhizobium guangzhouense]QAU48617.1 IS630 family transposase [Bradyrhizobium guangzhouense]QAU49832.1 IS630 family transposase [Bradyrhizobium guangzhouense]RXH01721.1 IS630 family transposase [Bradyrhizobium guangzhouense]